LALIFNTSNGALGGPVNRSRGVSTDAEIGKSFDGFHFTTSEFGFVSIVSDLEFSGGKISEFVQFNFPGVVASVVSGNEVEVTLENSVFVEEFFWGIGFVEFDHPLNESVFIDRFRNRGKSHSRDK